MGIRTDLGRLQPGVSFRILPMLVVSDGSTPYFGRGIRAALGGIHVRINCGFGAVGACKPSQGVRDSQ